MEDKKISEKESLELITRMIRETQDRTARYAAYPWLIWGYTTVFVTIAIWCLFQYYASWKVNCLWVALPVIGCLLNFIFVRREGKPGVKNYIDRIITQLWIVFGGVAFTLSFLAFFVRIDILFIISLLMGMATTLSGLVSKYKPIVVAGTSGTILSFFLLFIQGTDKLLVFAAIFIVMMIIPGHLLNKHVKQCLKN